MAPASLPACPSLRANEPAIASPEVSRVRTKVCALMPVVPVNARSAPRTMFVTAMVTAVDAQASAISRMASV